MSRLRLPAATLTALATALAVAILPAAAADVTNPAEVTNLLAATSGSDISLSWDAVTTDQAGNPETIANYNVYRGDTPDFTPDKTGGSNRIGTPAGTSFTDVGAAGDGLDHYYLVSAVDSAANEGLTRDSKVTAPPVLSGGWTATTIDVNWTDAQPVAQVSGYRVYYGKASGMYEFVDDVGLVNAHSLSGLELNVNWYIAVTAIDMEGNESAFSNEHFDAVNGTIEFRLHNGEQLPPPPQERNVLAQFPEGDWANITVTWSVESRLCDAPTVPDRCGDTNPGWNPCGDPWDRTATLYLVTDAVFDAGTCYDSGGASTGVPCTYGNPTECAAGETCQNCVDRGNCRWRDGNIELVRTITPFGTDAPPPDGNGIVPPRVWTFDLTRLAPVLTGDKYVGAHIGTWVTQGWWTTVDFHFNEAGGTNPVSPDPPAAGVIPVFFSGDETLAPVSVSIPATATSVIARYFVTGHGGSLHCDGGSNDGTPCSTNGDCPGGSCQNCDEFCHRNQRILVDGSSVFETVPWRDCCWPRGSLFCDGCRDWNSCGYPSCTFDRAGWCPGEIACHYNLDDGCDQDLDATSWLPPGATYGMTYEIPVRNGSWSKSLVLFWYE